MHTHRKKLILTSRVHKHMNLFIISSNIDFISSLKFLVENQLSYNVIGTEECGDAFINSNEFDDTDVLLWEIKCPGHRILDIANEMLWRNHRLKIIGIIPLGSGISLLQLLEAGLSGSVIKEHISTQLAEAIQMNIRGRVYFPDEIDI